MSGFLRTITKRAEMFTIPKLTTMASNPFIFSGKSPILFHSIGNHVNLNFQRAHLTTIKPLNSVTSIGHRSFSPCRFHCNPHKSLFTEGLRNLGNDQFLVKCTDGGGGTGGSDCGGGGSGGGGGGGNNWSFLSWYLSLLEAHPVWTKAITSAILTFVGDLICQVWIDQVPSLDLKRVSLFTFLGMALVGPTLHFWYLYLSKLVTTTGAVGAFVRLLVDQFIFAPVFIGVFLSTLVTLEGRPSQVLPKLQQEWVSSVFANWQLWIPFQFLNFRFVPQQFQVLAANFIALVWNVILSYKAHKEVAAK